MSDVCGKEKMTYEQEKVKAKRDAPKRWKARDRAGSARDLFIARLPAVGRPPVSSLSLSLSH